jgi:phospholipid N-methyltransferase
MAQVAAASDRGGSLLEIGAGSGALTRALVARFGRERLQVVECSPPLASVLRQRFPQLTVLEQRAEQVLTHAMQCADQMLVVSSLPFKSLPLRQARRVAKAYQDLVMRGGSVVQFSYGRLPPFPLSSGVPLRWQAQCRVWRNLPPATVWQLCRV